MKSAFPSTWDEMRRSFWLLPALGVALGVGLAFALTAIDATTQLKIPVLGYEQPPAARTLLQTMATVSVSVGGVAFSVTVVAFQLASQQLSPRVLRTFQADRLSQSLLATLLGLFVYCVIVLARLPGAPNATAPSLSLTVGVADAVFSFGLFAAFIHNVVISLQASTVIRRIAADGHHAIDAAYPASIGDPPSNENDAAEQVRQLKRNRCGRLVRAARAGFLQTVRHDDIIKVSRKHDALVEQCVALGDFIVTGTAIAEIWAESAPDEVEEEVAAVFHLADERSPAQDVAFPVRQLADVALRALSPSLNDPTTAENAMGSLADTLVVFLRQERPSAIRCDADGTPRFVAIAPTLDDLVRLGFEQVRRASLPHPTLASRLMTLLAHIDAVARDNGVSCDETGRQHRLLETGSEPATAPRPRSPGQRDNAYRCA